MLRYYMIETLMKFEKDWLLNFLLIFLSSLIIALFGFLLLFSINLDSIIKNLALKASAYAYLREEAKVEELKERILDVEGVSSVSYISPDEALKEVEGAVGERISISELFGYNPLPGAFRVWFSEFNQIEGSISKIEEMEEVDEVEYPKKVLLLLSWLAKISKNYALWIAALFSIFILIFVLVKLNIHSREEEVRVFKQLGASTPFFFIPSLLHGWIFGLTGGCIGILGLWLLHNSISLPFIFLSIKLVGLLLLGGGLMGLFCSLLSILPFRRRSFEVRE